MTKEPEPPAPASQPQPPPPSKTLLNTARLQTRTARSTADFARAEALLRTLSSNDNGDEGAEAGGATEDTRSTDVVFRRTECACLYERSLKVSRAPTSVRVLVLRDPPARPRSVARRRGATWACCCARRGATRRPRSCSRPWGAGTDWPGAGPYEYINIFFQLNFYRLYICPSPYTT